MLMRISVDFGSRCLHDFSLEALSKPKHVYGPVYIDFRRLNGVVLVMYGRGWTGKIVNLINFNIERIGNVVPIQFEIRVLKQLHYIAFTSRV